MSSNFYKYAVSILAAQLLCSTVSYASDENEADTAVASAAEENGAAATGEDANDDSAAVAETSSAVGADATDDDGAGASGAQAEAEAEAPDAA
jgi:hypothetical protein